LIARVRVWAGPGRIAVLLSGSHAAGDAVWVDHRGRPVSLSDVDLYVLLPSREACRAAEARASREVAGLREWLLEQGFAAPLEAAFLTPADLERLPPRPATLELGVHARVVEGDPASKGRVPAFTARDVPAEEVTLLLENRGFELLLAHPAVAGDTPLDRMRARHGLLKTALDLAGVAALRAGEYPDRAAARVAWARAHPLRLVVPVSGAGREPDGMM
jgi:predicted nucleotidyltransferase